jgi:hypothetical protein
VTGPAITLVDARRHSRLKSRHGALGFREPLSKLDFELCDLMLTAPPGQDVAGQQTHSELVRVGGTIASSTVSSTDEATDMAAPPHATSDACIYRR